MGKTLIEVFHDHPGVVQHQFPVYQGGHALIGIQIDEILGLVGRIDGEDLDGDAFFRKHHPRPVTLRIERIRKQGHD